jgi:phosphoglycolate phosphatase-like HAD superfamily hydrolase
MNTRFLALDFDGVIGDSIHECLVVGFNAYQQYLGTNKKVYSFEELNPGSIEQARAIRNYIRSGEDYVYIYHALENKAPILSQDDFDAFTQTFSSLRDRFFEVFYSERQRFLDHHREQWLRLNPLYPGMQPWLQKYPHKDRLVIITTKKTEYVAEILKFHDIILKSEALYHASPKHPKKDIIASLLQRYEIEPSEFVFIDDQVDTLIKVKPVQVKCILALWGYNTLEQQKTAQKNNIPGCELEDFWKQNYP